MLRSPLGTIVPGHMAEILLCTLNSSYQHTAFGLRYLYANMKDLQDTTKLLEFTIAQKPRDIVEKILEENPRIVGFGVYIWNTRETQEVVSLLKRISPEILVILGGPEVSYETETQKICLQADFVMKGESDFRFYEFCAQALLGTLPEHKFLEGELPEVTKIHSPYSYYSNEDLRNRVLYVEASRGCPYKCEYCLSSLDKSVRNFPIDDFLKDMDNLIQRGARQFKFVDRTFNLSPSISTKILQFFLDRISLGLFLHFEMVPDRLPTDLRVLIEKFPMGSLQFEIGIQTWNPQVSALVSRRQDYTKIRENFAFLREKTKVHTHADLIVGLPGETLESFAQGFDTLAELHPDEIQVGILKRLKGTPIIRHDKEWQMTYQEHPPFQILTTKTMNYFTLQKMNRFAKFWDLIANSGNFVNTMDYIKKTYIPTNGASLFGFFFNMSAFLSKRHSQGHGIALLNLVESIWIYLTQNLQADKNTIRDLLILDYAGNQTKRDIPLFLRVEKQQLENARKEIHKTENSFAPQRQQRHAKNSHPVYQN